MTMLKNLERLPLDPIFQLLADYIEDQNPEKVSLGIGIYTDEEGMPLVFPSIKQAFAEVDADNFNYQPIGGNRDFLNAVAEFALDGMMDVKGLALQASCGGTQACSMFGALMARDEVKRKLWVGTPTWGNHFSVFSDLEAMKFDHLTPEGEVNFEAYKKALEQASEGDVILLHGGLTHNPTGRNLSLEQTKELLPLLEKMVVYIDFAYMGFGDGMDEDKQFAKLLFEKLENVAMGISFSKNASLYEHRTGVLMIKTDRKEVLESQVQQIARESISMAPGIGQEMMLNVLESKQEQWLQEVEAARMSIEKRKRTLIDNLPDRFAGMVDCRGMFGLMPLSRDEILQIREEYSVYLPANGRINFAGIKIKDIDYLLKAFSSV